MSPQSKKQAISGTTVNAYTDIVVLSLPWARTRIYLKNTDGANSLDYKVYGYMDSKDKTDSGTELVAETALGTATVYTALITDPWDIIIVSVKPTVPDSQATYKLFANRMEA